MNVPRDVPASSKDEMIGDGPRVLSKSFAPGAASEGALFQRNQSDKPRLSVEAQNNYTTNHNIDQCRGVSFLLTFDRSNTLRLSITARFDFLASSI
jgi:hypothetical protein